MGCEVCGVGVGCVVWCEVLWVVCGVGGGVLGVGCGVWD